MNPRLLVSLLLLCLVLAVSTSSLADTLYNNLEAGNVASAPGGYCLGTGSCASSYWIDAIAFTPSETAALADIGIALAYVSGQNSATIQLLSDSSGLPGSLIESWTVNNLSVFQKGAATSATFVASNVNPILDAGQQYWVAVIAGTPGDKANLLYWMAPQPAAYTPFATSQDGGPYTIVPNPYVGDGGFRVDGTPVPEPSNLIMFGSGALGLLGVFRRKLGLVKEHKGAALHRLPVSNLTSPQNIRHLPLRLVLLPCLALICTQTVRADLISVAFNSPNQYGLAPLISGPDAASTAADPLFGTAIVWNNLNIPFGILSTNPTWGNLVNSTGGVTSGSLQITGTVAGVDFYPFISGLNPLRSESVAWNDNASGNFTGISTSISWALAGLVPNATYNMCVYGSQANYNRSFNMTIEGTTLNIPTYDATTSSPTPNCVLFTNIQSDGSGVITGVGMGIGDPSQYTSEADWSGFQIVQVPDASAVPEPSSLFLLGTGSLTFLGGLLIRSRAYRWH